MTVPGIVVADYNPDWPRRAEVLIEFVIAASRGTVHHVDHIGSTAIPGMAAKNVIDLQATVDDLDRSVDALEAPLATAGFSRRPFDHDHVPAGLVDDPGRWIKRMFSRPNHPDGAVNLHVRLIGSPNARLALLFRDWFRAHPHAVPAYAAFKRQLAADVADLGVYSVVKDPVVDLVVTIAESWAADIGWSP